MVEEEEEEEEDEEDVIFARVLSMMCFFMYVCTFEQPSIHNSNA